MGGAGAGGEDLGGEAGVGDFGILRRRGHVGRAAGGSAASLISMSSTSKTSMPCGCARTSAVGEIFGDPETAFLADDHELDALGPAGDHPVEGEGGGLSAGDRRVEHLAVGGPAGVVDGDRVPRIGVDGAGALVKTLEARPVSVTSASAGGAATSAGAATCWPKP